jgi:DNA topoisomerase-3
LTCPLDGFELVIFSFGPGQKSYPVCPFCYNFPNLEGSQKRIIILNGYLSNL